MKKFYYKKSVSQEETPILVRLERRHTLLEAAKEANDPEWQKMAARAKRTDSVEALKDFSQAPPRAPPPGRRRLTTASISSDPFGFEFSPSSTVTITESDLSSSWIYKNKKAAAVSATNAAFEDSPEVFDPSTATQNGVDPTILQEPEIRTVSVPMAKRPAKCSTCCCYFTVLLVVCLCSIGILSVIGGIVYLEIFAAYRSVIGNSSLVNEGADVAVAGMHLNRFSTKDFAEKWPGLLNVLEPSGKEVERREGQELGKDGTESSERHGDLEVTRKITDSYMDQNLFNSNPNGFSHDTQPNIDLSANEKNDSSSDRIMSGNLATSDSSSDEIMVRNLATSDSSSDGILFRNLATSDSSSDEIMVRNLANGDSSSDEIMIRNLATGVPEESEPAVDSIHEVHEVSIHQDEDSDAKVGQDHKSVITIDSQADETSFAVSETTESEGLNQPIQSVNVALPMPIEFFKRLGTQEDPVQERVTSTGAKGTADMKSLLAEVLKPMRTLDKEGRLPDSRSKSLNLREDSRREDRTTTESSASDEKLAEERKTYLQNLRVMMSIGRL